MRHLCITLVAGLALVSRSQQPAVPANPAPPPSLVAANNAFGFHLYHELTKTDATQNVFISPVSIEYALAMVANGARGNTYTQLAHTLGWGDVPTAEVNAGFHTLTNRLMSTDPNLQLTLANSLWMKDNVTFHPDFVHANTQYFGAELRTVNFPDPTTVPAINAWAKEKTRGMIPTVLKPHDVDDLTMLVLINAIYFKGTWATPFDAHLTTEQPFTLADGTPRTVKMMQRRGAFYYYADAQLQMIELGYDVDNWSLVVILPAAGQSLDATAQQVLSEEHWLNYLLKLRPRPGELDLPRFSASYDIELIPALQALGITDAFANANFSGICDLPFFIYLVQHITALEVTEKGTKAAAVTAIGNMGTSSGHHPEDSFVMKVNRPFLLALQNQDGALLFLGRITAPDPVKAPDAPGANG
jgi:serpin B